MTASSVVPEEEIDAEVISAELGRRRRRRRLVVGFVVVAALAAGGTVLVVRHDHAARESNPIVTVPTNLVQITKGDLVARTSVSGTLGYAGSYEAINEATGSYSWLPATGTVVKPGDVLYRVDEKPVVYLRGSVPMYRDLSSGLSGRDVQQLNAGLVAAGYDADGDLDPASTKYNRATATAVKALQKHLHLTKTGQLAKSDVVFVPAGRIRVGALSGKIGTAASAGAAAFTGTSTDRQVTANVDASLQSRLKVGQQVKITLPTGGATDGTVSSVSTVVTKDSAGKSVITVQITPKQSAATGNLDQAPVGVSIVTESVKGALVVPVNALLALLGGGYGLEVVDPAGVHKLVAVELGLFDDTAGTVSIKGAGIAAGQNVVVPTS